MNQKQRDDLFENSTMTFGEHLEELRGALGRSLIGLIVGFLIALPFADDAVRLVTSPLKRALSRVYLAQATDKMTTTEAAGLTPEEWALLDERKLIPSTVQLDLSQIVRELTAGEIRDDASWEALMARPLPADIEVTDVVPIAQQFTTNATAWLNAPAKAVWHQLSAEDQAKLQALANMQAATPSQRDELLAILERLLADPQLNQLEELANLKSLFPLEGPRRAVAELRAEVAKTDSPQDRIRLNRWLVSAALDLPVLAPRPRVVDVRIWKPVDVSVQALNAQEPFLILIKAALILGLLIASPWVFYHIWNFVAAGLYPTERKQVYTFLPFSLGLFFLGASLAFFFVFDPVLDFLFAFNTLMKIEAAPRISEWVSFVLFLPLGFGLSFQLPLIMLLLERIGVFTIDSYLSRWRIAILIIFTISMFLTPSDPMSMLLMGIPLTLLYFIGILLCRWMPRQQSPVGVGYDPQG